MPAFGSLVSSPPPRGARRLWASLSLLVAIAVAALAFLPGQASAAGPAFSLGTPKVFVSQGSSTQLEEAVQSNGELVFHNLGTATTEYNAIAFDPLDGYIYGVEIPTREIIQIDANGGITGTGVQSGAPVGPANNGVWDPGTESVYFGNSEGGAASQTLEAYDPATGATSNIALSAKLETSDLAAAGGFLWGLSNFLRPPVMQRIDPTTGTVTNIPVPAELITGFKEVVAGAAWTYGNGNIGLSNNGSGTIVQISIANPASATPTFKLVSHQPGPANSTNDGTAIAGLPTDLALTKISDPASVAPGGQITYTITVKNNGPGDSSGYVVEDKLPSALSNPKTTTVGCRIEAGVLNCVGSPLAAGATATITLTGNAPNPATGSITNTATVTGNEEDPVPGNNTATVVTPPRALADLSITKTASPAVAVPGENETYTLTITNNGPDPAVDAAATDKLPSGLSYVSSEGCTFASGTVTCSAGTLAPGATKTFKIVTKIGGSVTQRIVNTADATSKTEDPNPGNNTATTETPIGPKTDLQITKTPSVPSIVAGGQVMYTLVVTNNGPSDATGVTVSDALPNGLTLAALKGSQGSCAMATGTCNLGSLPAGGSAQVLVTANVAAGAGGSLKNAAKVTGDQPDPNPNNNTDEATITVTNPPAGPPAPPQTTPAPPAPAQPVSDVKIVKTVNVAAAYPGQKLTYTLKVTNDGPDTAANVNVTDTSTLPTKVISAKPGQGSCKVGRPLTCSLGSLAKGKTVVIKVVAKAKQAGSEKDAASVTSSSRDTNPDNNLDAAVTKVAPKLLLRKTASPRKVYAGGGVRYSLVASNPTTVAIHDVRVCDSFPGGLAFAGSTPKASIKKGRVCWRIKTIGAGASRTIRVLARALPGARGNLTNHATASAKGVKTVKAKATVNVVPAPLKPTPVTG